MHFRTAYHSILFYKQIFRCCLEMPFYAVIFRTTKSGSIADNWDLARGMRDASQNSYAKKFATKTEAEKYIKDFNFKIVQNTKSPSIGKGVKRKLIERPNNSMINAVKDFNQKVNKAFKDLQVSVKSLPEFSDAFVDQIKNLNCEVIDKLNKILNVNETESNEDLSLSIATNNQFLNGALAFSNQEDKSSTSTTNLDITGSLDLAPSELEAAKKSFTLNEKKEVIVYTDGACSNNGYKGASAGAGVWFGISHPLNLAIKVPGVQTNNNAEIFSIIKAIERVKATGLTKISIHTDSDFVIKSINEWMPRWQSNGWKTSAGSEVKNKDMFMILHYQIQSMDSVSWTHVPGHSGVLGNEEADKLARLGAK